MDAKTVHSLVEQFQENTGRHMLDSGDAYGRGWERWAARGDADALTAAMENIPTATVTAYGVSVATIPYLAEILTFDEKADKKFQKWVERDDKVTGETSPWLVSAERYVNWLFTGDPEKEPDDYGYAGGVVNTYNFDCLLDETLQYISFECPVSLRGLVEGEHYVLLQTHNGCDVRGGYSRPRVYRLEDADHYISDPPLSAYHSIDHPQEEMLEGMPEREDFHQFDLYGTEWVDRDGTGLTGEDAPQVVEQEGGPTCLACPVCGSALEVACEV